MATAVNSRICRSILLTITIFSLSLPAYAQYSGGTGEPNDPYQIATAADLIALGETPADYDKHFILTADIDLDPNLPGRKVFDRAVIAPGTYVLGQGFRGTPFTGVFDGKGHTISHLTIQGTDFLGLFGWLGEIAFRPEVKNLGVVDANITGLGDRIGALAGRNEGAVIRCYSTGAVMGSDDVGGLVGDDSRGNVSQCYSSAAVSADERVGGLMGRNFEGTVTQCYSTGVVSGTGYRVGGLVGCYEVSDPMAWRGNHPVPAWPGCFWDTQTSGQTWSHGGTGKTTAQMQTAKTFLDAGWDFAGEPENGTHEVWQMPEGGGYPVLTTMNGYGPPRLQGDGTLENPYLISDALELGAMVHYSPFAHYRLVASIDLSSIRWAYPVIPTFSGSFDGNNQTISHLTVEGGRYVGLFGQLESGAEVRDLGVVAVNVTGSDHVGGLAGSNASIVTHCFSTGVVSGDFAVGGLVGYNEYAGTVTQCYSTGAVSGSDWIGGLVGYNEYAGTVTQCYSTGAVSGSDWIGGLVGNNREGTLTQCYSTGTVCGGSSVGGLVGGNYFGTVTESYSTGAVSTTGQYSSVGGLVGGRGDPGDVLESVWDVETSGLSGSAGGVGLTTAEMMDPHMLGLNGFANDPNWVLDPGRDYPRLAWQSTAGQVIPEPNIDWLVGGGTQEDPYRIDTADQLIQLGRASIFSDKHLVLGEDIDLDPRLQGRRVFAQAVIPAFTGVFDGDGHTISHLTIEGKGFVGLFGILDSGAEVKNMGVVDVNIIGSDSDIGALVGGNRGDVTHCYSTGAVSATREWGLSVGGLVGRNSDKGILTHCYSTGTVSGRNCVGGLVGDNREGTLTQCYSTGTVCGWSSVGGLVGGNYLGTVSESYSTGAVSATGQYASVGGLAGTNSWGTVTECYSTGAVSTTGQYSSVGGLVGYVGEKSKVTTSFWDTQTSGQVASAGGTGKTTAQMQTASTFLDAGWDFVGETANGTADIWWILEGQDYPRLWWEAIQYDRETVRQ